MYKRSPTFKEKKLGKRGICPPENTVVFEYQFLKWISRYFGKNDRSCQQWID